MNKILNKLPALVDSHAHLDFKIFNRDRDAVIQRAESYGLKLVINVGFNMPSSREAVALSEKYSLIYAAVGVHPHDAANVPDDYLAEMREMAQHPKVVALGEMGLDYYRDRSPRWQQWAVFSQQLRLAREVNLPVVIHSRNAHPETMSLLKEEGLPEAGGVMHCFSGDLELAEQMMEMGLYISIAGPVTYPRNNVLKQVAASIPAERLLVETDAPFLPPGPWRGKRNEPAYTAFTVEKIAELRGTTAENLGRICLENARRLFSRVRAED
ncbi:MAG: TatD family hydrolase [Dethiobacteria bacterium]|jgi:TatD DNase family protein